MLRLSGLLLLLVTALPLLAGEERFGDDIVYYSAFNSSFISQDVARAYGVTRGKNRALVTVAVRRENAEGSVAVTAQVTGINFDLIHKKPLDFREVREQDAIYYIAEFPFNDKELRSFTLTIQPAGVASSFDIKFNQTFYADE